MYEYDLYLPLSLDDGRLVAEDVINHVKERLLNEFGGVTEFRYRNEGLWRVGKVTYCDDITVLRTLAEDQAKARKYLSSLKSSLKEELSQEDILVVERSVTAV